MKIFKGKGKVNIVLILVFTMMIQILVPSILDVTFAVNGEEEENQTEFIEIAEPLEGEDADESEDDDADNPGEDDATKSDEDEENVDGDGVITEEEVVEDAPVKDGMNFMAALGDIVPLSGGESKELEDIFTLDRLNVGGSRNEQGEIVGGTDVEDNSIIKIEEGTQVQIQFFWNTKDKDAKSGDWAAIQLPDIFNYGNDVTGQPIPVSLEDGGFVNVGTYSIINGKLSFLFNKNIERNDVENGKVGFALKFDLTKFEDNIEQVIKFSYSKDTTLKVIAEPSNLGSGISKGGRTPDDIKQNAEYITWTIDVVNTTAETIASAKVEDKIPVGLGVARDFKVYNLDIGIKGKKTLGEERTPDPTEFPITFTDMKPYTGYRIEYKTDIDYKVATTDANGVYSFTNNATFEYDGKPLPAGATVGGLTRNSPIEKSGEALDKNTTDKIKWTIDINKNGQSIENAIVEDTLPDGLTVDKKTIQVVKIIQEGDNWDSTGKKHSNPTIDETNGFSIGLGELTKNDAYRIIFETTVDWSKVNTGTYLDKNGFENVATLYDGVTKLNDDDATVTFNRDPILEKVGVSNVNYTNKTITWTVTVNEAKHPLGDVIVTDYLPKGLELIKDKDDNIEIEVKIGEEVQNAGYIVAGTQETGEGIHNGKTKLTINLENVGTETITIEYKTRVIDFSINSFVNYVGMTGVGIGEGGNDRDAEVKPAINTFNKKFKGINYKAKTMDWELEVDPRRESISAGFKIEDTFPNKGMTLLPGEVVVKLGNDTLKLEEDYTLSPRTVDSVEHYKNGFIMTINKEVNQKLVVTYKTSYDPEDDIDPHEAIVGDDKGNTDRLYVNRANFTGKTQSGIEIKQTRDASQRVREDSWNSGKKEGQLVREGIDGKLVNGWISGSERKIAWQLYINYQDQNLGTGVVVTDELQYEGIIDRDSIKVSVYDVNKDGTTEFTKLMLLTENYDVKFGEETKDNVKYENFTLTFADGFNVEKRYVIEYTTTVPNISQDKYTNNAKVRVSEVEYPYVGTVKYEDHKKFLNKGATGVTGSVYTGEEINWEVKVNESLSIIKENVKIVDTISPGLVYVKDSLKIYKLENGKEELLTEGEGEGEDYTLDVDPNTEDGKTVLTINFNENVKHTLIVRYTTVVTATKDTVSNSVEFSGENIETKTVESEELSASQFSWVSGQFSSNRGAIRVIKVDSEELDGDKKNKVIDKNEATFKLEYYLNGKRVQFGENFTTKNGVLEIGGLLFRTYYLTEVKAPNGYEKSEKVYTIEVTEGYSSEDKIYQVDFKNTKEKIDVTGTKVWVGGENNRPDSIYLQLYRNGEKHGAPQELTDAEKNGEGNWIYTWTDLDRTNRQGDSYTYTVKEVDSEGNDYMPTNYTKSEYGLTVTNTYVIPKTEITGTKVWLGGSSTKPTIELQLYRDGVALEGEGYKVELDGTEDTPWTHTWTNQNKTDESGKEYTYTVDEVNTPRNYRKSISEDGLTVTNRYVPPTTQVKATKIWVGGPKDRPEVQLQLYRNGVAYGEPVILEDGETDYTWTNLPLDSYTVDEVNVPENYESTVDGFTITNKYVIPKIDIKGTKVWIGGPEEKPTIELQLYRNGEAYGNPVTLEDGETEYAWIDLDKTDIEGNLYEYSVDEVNLPEDYVKTISEDGLTITNTYEDPTDPPLLEGEEYEEPKDPKDPTDPPLLKGEEYENDPDPKDPTDPNGKGDKGKLPKTGQSNNIILPILGIILLAAGFVLRKRKTN